MTSTDTATQAPTKAQSMAAGLRELADAIESGALPCPFEISPSIYWETGPDGRITDHVTADTARAAMARAPGNWDKRYSGNFVVYEKTFGPHITYSINPQRDEVCRRVQVGVKHVPAHDEPEYEWECGPADAEPADGQ